ncbi:hypothetical protein HanXRQr2_Chr01g0002531 [Helianthus annuus]|uniref:Uncharacterized protein n=1 Tax=Helianthus annuus TaxID=4232 RepID=A0A9K3P1G4_HELAN|nr:hypothetical protein HanXRQr2_Chr01g0002531 [Helianthus annuus]
MRFFITLIYRGMRLTIVVAIDIVPELRASTADQRINLLLWCRRYIILLSTLLFDLLLIQVSLKT